MLTTRLSWRARRSTPRCSSCVTCASSVIALRSVQLRKQVVEHLRHVAHHGDRAAVLQKAFAEAAQTDKFKKFMESRGEEAKGSSSAEFRKLIDSEYAAVAKVMPSLGLAKQ